MFIFTDAMDFKTRDTSRQPLRAIIITFPIFDNVKFFPMSLKPSGTIVPLGVQLRPSLFV